MVICLNRSAHIQGDLDVGGTRNRNRLGEVHGEVEVLPDDIGTIGGHAHRGYGGSNPIHQHGRCIAHTVEGEVGSVARDVLNGSPVGLDYCAHGYSIGVGVALNHGVAEHQGASTRAALVGSMNRSALVESDLNVWVAHHRNRLGEVHGEIEVLPDDVGVIGGYIHGGYRWLYAIHQYVRGAAHVVEGEIGIVANAALNGGTIGFNGGAQGDPISIEVVLVHGVMEHQGFGSRTAEVIGADSAGG